MHFFEAPTRAESRVKFLGPNSNNFWQKHRKTRTGIGIGIDKNIDGIDKNIDNNDKNIDSIDKNIGNIDKNIDNIDNIDKNVDNY